MNFRKFILMRDQFGESEAIGRAIRKSRVRVWVRDGLYCGQRMWYEVYLI